MPQFVPVENYADNTVLTQAQLHALAESIADFLNDTKIDEENIQPGSITSQSLAANAVQSSNIQSGSITSAQLANDVVLTLVPTGSVTAFAGTLIPAGWLYCDGSAVDRTVFAALFGQIGILHGQGDGVSSFNLPDYRGQFLRGMNDSTGNDPDVSGRTAPALGGSTGDQVGSVQLDAFEDHTHNNSLSDPGHTHSVLGRGPFSFGGSSSNDFSLSNAGGRFPVNGTGASGTGMSINNGTTGSGEAESRPKNKYIKYMIKT